MLTNKESQLLADFCLFLDVAAEKAENIKENLTEFLCQSRKEFEEEQNESF